MPGPTRAFQRFLKARYPLWQMRNLALMVAWSVFSASAPPWCAKDLTVGSCNMLPCNQEPRGDCVDTNCICSRGMCAHDDICHPVPAKNASDGDSSAGRVAVVGCGVAGALTALELASLGHAVTVVEREADCGVGTSG